MDEQNNNKNNLQLARKQRRRTWWKNTPANVHGERDSEFYFIVKYIFECVCVCVCVCVCGEREKNFGIIDSKVYHSFRLMWITCDL